MPDDRVEFTPEDIPNEVAEATIDGGAGRKGLIRGPIPNEVESLRPVPKEIGIRFLLNGDGDAYALCFWDGTRGVLLELYADGDCLAMATDGSPSAPFVVADSRNAAQAINSVLKFYGLATKGLALHNEAREEGE
jgi:hypothetical protein